MGKGQERDAGVGAAEAEFRSGVVDVGGDVAVGEHDAFGIAGGARGVDEGGEIAGLDRPCDLVEVEVGLCIGDQRRELPGAGSVFLVHDDDVIEGAGF